MLELGTRTVIFHHIVANKANVSEKTIHHAMNLMTDVTKNGISAGKDPMGLAATVLYASCIKTGKKN